MRALAVLSAAGITATAVTVAFAGGARDQSREVRVAVNKTLALPSLNVAIDQNLRWGTGLTRSARGRLDNRLHRIALSVRETSGWRVQGKTITDTARKVVNDAGTETLVSTSGRGGDRTRPWATFYRPTNRVYYVDALLDITADAPQVLRIIRDAGSHATRVGRARIHGVPTTCYRVHVVVGSYPRAFPATQRDTAREDVATLANFYGATDYDADVWVGDNGVIRRVNFTLSFKSHANYPVESAEPFATLAVTVDLSKAGSR
jgi:hypothetical protein